MTHKITDHSCFKPPTVDFMVMFLQVQFYGNSSFHVQFKAQYVHRFLLGMGTLQAMFLMIFN